MRGSATEALNWSKSSYKLSAFPLGTQGSIGECVGEFSESCLIIRHFFFSFMVENQREGGRVMCYLKHCIFSSQFCHFSTPLPILSPQFLHVSEEQASRTKRTRRTFGEADFLSDFPGWLRSPGAHMARHLCVRPHN